jgi:L-aminopeptidase/D-esterase-like protein
MIRSFFRPLRVIFVSLLLLSPAPSTAGQAVAERPGRHDSITDVRGVRVGHYTVRQGILRGTTAVLFDGSGILSMDVRGGNPVTLGDSIFNPITVGEHVDAVVLTGGSFFGLASVAGVVDYLYENGRGYGRLTDSSPSSRRPSSSTCGWITAKFAGQ